MHGQRSVQRPHDLADGDLVRPALEETATALAAFAVEETRRLELGKDRFEELYRQGLRRGDLRNAQQRTTYGMSQAQVDQRAQGVLTPYGQPHARKYCEPVDKCNRLFASGGAVRPSAAGGRPIPETNACRARSAAP
jgi:hypothetical protein